MSDPTPAPDQWHIIGDVHGRLDLLLELVASLPDSGSGLAFLGDLVDRGPDSAGVLEEVLRLREERPVVCLLGNHEAALLHALQDPERASWLGMGGLATVHSYTSSLPQEAGVLDGRMDRGLQLRVLRGFQRSFPESHRQLLQGMPLYHRLQVADGEYLLVHAGLRPWIGPPEYQDPSSLLYACPAELVGYAEAAWLVVGHNRTDWLRDDQRPRPTVWDNRVIFLDTGAHCSGVLTALTVPGRAFTSTGAGSQVLPETRFRGSSSMTSTAEG